MTVVFSLLGCSIMISVAEMMITWGFGHLTDETDEFTAAWMFSCIINSAALAFLIVKHFGMFE